MHALCRGDAVQGVCNIGGIEKPIRKLRELSSVDVRPAYSLAVMMALAAIGYLIGSIPLALVIGKVFYRTDIREHGSKNPGGGHRVCIPDRGFHARFRGTGGVHDSDHRAPPEEHRADVPASGEQDHLDVRAFWKRRTRSREVLLRVLFLPCLQRHGMPPT